MYIIQTFDMTNGGSIETHSSLFNKPEEGKEAAIKQQRFWEGFKPDCSFFTIICDEESDTTIDAIITKDETIFDMDKATEKFEGIFVR